MKENATLTSTTATINSMDTPFVRTIEPWLKEQQVAARLMQVHDKAHTAVSCTMGKNYTDIGVTYGDVDGGRRIGNRKTYYFNFYDECKKFKKVHA